MNALIIIWSIVSLSSGAPKDVYALRESIKDANSGQEIVRMLGEPASKYPIITCVIPMLDSSEKQNRKKHERHEGWVYRAENGELTITVGKDEDSVCNRFVRLTKEEFLKRVKVGVTIARANTALDGASSLGPFKKPVGKRWVDTGIWSSMGVDSWFEAKVDPKTERIIEIIVKPRKR